MAAGAEASRVAEAAAVDADAADANADAAAAADAADAAVAASASEFRTGDKVWHPSRITDADNYDDVFVIVYPIYSSEQRQTYEARLIPRQPGRAPSRARGQRMRGRGRGHGTADVALTPAILMPPPLLPARAQRPQQQVAAATNAKMDACARQESVV